MADNDNPLASKKVLVVDDEAEILETIEDMILDRVGELDPAHSYEKARKQLQTKKYDLAVFDLMGVRGLDLVREFAKETPCIVITGQEVRPVTIDFLMEHGVKAYLPKPDITELERCMRIVVTAPNSMELWELFMKAKNRGAQGPGKNAKL